MAREAFERLEPELQSDVSNKDALFSAEETFEQLEQLSPLQKTK